MSHRIRKPSLKDNTVLYTLSAFGGCAFAIPYGIQTLFIDKYTSYYEKKKVHSTLETEFPMKVPSDIKGRFNEVLDKLEFDDFKKNLGSIFVTTLPDIFCAGFTKSRFGFKLGIPQNYLCHNEDEIRELGFLVDDDSPVLWDSADGQLLSNSLLLSELAQKYAFAKHICLTDTYRIMIVYCLPLLLVSLLDQTIKKAQIKVRQYPTRIKAIVYGTIVIFYSFLWLNLYDSINMIYEKNCEDNVLKLGGKLYMMGAVEYYDKLMKKNIALRSLTKNGQKYYKENGDYRRPLRWHIPLSVKKTYVQDMLKREYNEEEFLQVPTPRTMH